MTLDLFAAEAPALEDEVLDDGSVPPPGHAGRLPDVGGDDQLRRAGLGIGSPRLSLRPGRPGVGPALARDAASRAGHADFAPDACLVNRYAAGARLSMHQDRDEKDLRAPIVSVSLGLPAVFLWGGDERGDKARPVALNHGDVVVWGGASRRRFHGVRPLKDGEHPFAGARRVDLTFRKVLA